MYDIETDLFKVASEFFADKVNGKVYREGCRPSDSQKEDVVCFVSWANAKQIQEGECLLDIFVTDLPNKGNRQQSNKKRIGEVSSWDSAFLQLLNEKLVNEYTFHFSRATGWQQLPNSSQHYVTYPIKFKRKTF